MRWSKYQSAGKPMAKIGNWAHFSNNIISKHGFKTIFFTSISSLRDLILGYKLSFRFLWSDHVWCGIFSMWRPPVNWVSKTWFINQKNFKSQVSQPFPKIPKKNFKKSQKHNNPSTIRSETQQSQHNQIRERKNLEI